METIEVICLGFSMLWLGLSILSGAKFVITQTIINALRFVTELSLFALFFGVSFDAPIAYEITFGIFASVFLLSYAIGKYCRCSRCCCYREI
jgi:hypothetical protein